MLSDNRNLIGFDPRDPLPQQLDRDLSGVRALARDCDAHPLRHVAQARCFTLYNWSNWTVRNLTAYPTKHQLQPAGLPICRESCHADHLAGEGDDR